MPSPAFQTPPLTSLSHWQPALQRAVPLAISGRVGALRGNSVIAWGLPVAVGSICRIDRRDHTPLAAEAIGFDGQQTILAPLAPMDGVRPGDRVQLVESCAMVPIGPELVGRVLDAAGQPIDLRGPLASVSRVPIDATPLAPLDRPPIDRAMATGVRAIDALLTLGQGQRIGIFAGSGVGKSTLLGMLARGAAADVVVIALIGERGREVREFLERDLGEDGRTRSVTVVATSDQPAPRRLQAAKTATAIAEAFRSQGRNVLLMMDSVTRLATAQREVGLASGEVPTTRGYPPSVFSLLPSLVERAGRTQKGSITGIYTVLVDGDDPNEPISDTLRGLLDGHIHLSRAIAARGRFPAIDVLPSLSRLQNHLVSNEHLQAAARLRQTMADYADNEDLINIGAYSRGSSQQIDAAIALREPIERFLAQDYKQSLPWKQNLEELLRLFPHTSAGNFSPNLAPPAAA